MKAPTPHRPSSGKRWAPPSIIYLCCSHPGPWHNLPLLTSPDSLPLSTTSVVLKTNIRNQVTYKRFSITLGPPTTSGWAKISGSEPINQITTAATSLQTEFFHLLVGILPPIISPCPNSGFHLSPQVTWISQSELRDPPILSLIHF